MEWLIQPFDPLVHAATPDELNELSKQYAGLNHLIYLLIFMSEDDDDVTATLH